jgi:hypothetical protein
MASPEAKLQCPLGSFVADWNKKRSAAAYAADLDTYAIIL